MGLFKALGNLGKAVKDTVLLPVDVAKDVFDSGSRESRVERRVTKIGDEIEEAYEETFDDK